MSAVVGMLLGWSAPGAAQPAQGPTIQHVTLHEGAGVLTISGTGFGQEPLVTVDGYAVAVMPGATETAVAVQAPAELLLVSGTYRLTVKDPARGLEGTFVVASPAGRAAENGASGAPAPPNGQGPTGAPTAGASETTGVAVPTNSGLPAGPAPLTVIEDSSAPYRTAIGYQVLASTTGWYNTAIGYRALYANTTGNSNTASGVEALWSNTTGSNNTANGRMALYANTTGAYNTASGVAALQVNTTGNDNTASGTLALRNNTTGVANTANGRYALWANSAGNYNTASGAWALFNNTSSLNTASGYESLRANTTGTYNAAVGARALAANTTGISNTATGHEALRYTTTGGLNTASGALALTNNTTGNWNTANGAAALSAATTGVRNTALGYAAGANVTTGSDNVLVGADVWGTAADTNTIRIGRAYDSGAGTGQNQTFVAGIYGTELSGVAQQVFVDSNGQLGTITAAVGGGGVGTSPGASLAQEVAELRAMNARLQARLARLEALVASGAGRK